MTSTSDDYAVLIASIFAGLTALVSAFFAGARYSRCTMVKTPCFHCERQVQT